MNDENIQFFYKNLGIDPFKAISERGGFASYPDLEKIYDEIKDADSILELGAGYGRCLDYLLAKCFGGKLSAVEINPPYVEYLQKNYGQTVQIISQDIKKLNINDRFDVALFMFSGIIDFSRKEQKQAISQIGKHLIHGGKLYIDVPRLGYATYAEHKDLQHLHLENEYGTLDCYIPNDDDMEKYKKEGGFSSFTSLHYETPKEKKRTIYILRK